MRQRRLRLRHLRRPGRPVNKRKNIIVNCVYRTPGSDMQTFIDQIETVIKNVKKSIFLCGDLNIDLLKYNDNTPTKNFVDMMFSLGLYPLIDKPTRITDHSATLIDNIFTNELDSKINSGLLTEPGSIPPRNWN